MKKSDPWYEEAFSRAYLDVYAHRSDEAAAAEVSWIQSAMGMKRGDLVLDLACGGGRHARALAASEIRLIGIDLSMDLLRSGPRVKGLALIRGDMRRVPLRSACCTHVVNLFTSFGYFESDEENARVFGEVARVLCPGGLFLMDFLNAPAVEKGLVPRSSKVVQGRRFEEERRITPGHRRVEKTVTLIENDEPKRSWTESVRLFGRDEILAMMMASGLTVEETYGGLDGSVWSSEAPRLVVMARK